MQYIDLRSDTVTHPTRSMYGAMVAAEIGDDVFRDDVTTNRLEALAAEVLGKEASLYVASGTMGNLTALLAHETRGKEVILGETSHIFNSEVGGISSVAGAIPRTLTYPKGIPDSVMMEAAIRPADIHHVNTGLICVENALSNGRVVDKRTMDDIYTVAQFNDIPVHVDGARIFNAAVSLGVDVKELTQFCDTVTCCLSKGLCAPIGAILAGSRTFIDRARKYRKMLGGGMRQSGITASAGIIALTEMTKRLGDDHDNARYMAEKLSAIEGINIDLSSVGINMVFARIEKSSDWRASLPNKMADRGIKIYPEKSWGFRFVTHNDVTRADIDAFVSTMALLMEPAL